MNKVSQLSAGYLAAVMHTAEHILQVAFKMSNQSGGYLCVADPETGLPEVVMLFGEMDTLEARRSSRFSQEKCARLANFSGHCSSAQSRVVAEEKYAGAIQAKRHVYSFSGLSEYMDQAAMLVLARSVGELNHDEALWIASTWEDPLSVGTFRELSAATLGVAAAA